jgi:hypothetical protein
MQTVPITINLHLISIKITTVMKKFIVAFIVVSCISQIHLFAQVNLNNQVIVYFKSGVQRNPPANTTATVSSVNVLNVLNTYGIPASNVVPSFFVIY